MTSDKCPNPERVYNTLHEEDRKVLKMLDAMGFKLQYQHTWNPNLWLNHVSFGTSLSEPRDITYRITPALGDKA